MLSRVTLLALFASSMAFAEPITVSPSSASFGYVNYNASASKTFTLSNNSSSPVAFTTDLNSWAMTLQNNCVGSVVPAHGSCTLALTFAPPSTGSVSGWLTIASPGQPAISLPVSGTGQAPTGLPLALSPSYPSSAPYNYGAVPVGSAVAKTITITNPNPFWVSLWVGVGQDAYHDWSDTTDCGAALAAYSSCSVSVVFGPSQAYVGSGTSFYVTFLEGQSYATLYDYLGASSVPPVVPVISSVTPALGAVGTTVTLTGNYFNGVTNVSFNGTAAPYTVQSPTSLTATVPSGATSGKITVTSVVGTGTSASSFTVLAPPVVTGFSPASAATMGAVTIAGANFTGTSAVTINGVAAAFTVASATSIVATVPASATTGPVSVTTPAGTATSTASLIVIPPPAISSFSPTSGLAGTTVKLNGANFAGATSVTLNGAPAPFTVQRGGEITVTVPAKATSGTFAVTTPGGTATSATGFNVIFPTMSPTLAAWPTFTPASAPALTPSPNVTSPAGGKPFGLVVTPDGNWVLAAITEATATGVVPGLGVYQRSGAGGTTLTLVHQYAVSANETPFGLALSPDGATVAMGTSTAVYLYHLSGLEAGAPAAFIARVPTRSVKQTSIDTLFSPDGNFVFVALEYDNSVAVIDVVNRAYVGAIPIGGTAVTGLALSPNGSTLYVVCEVASEFAAQNPTSSADQNVGAITVVDVAQAETHPARSVIGKAFAGRAPVRIVASADGTTLWVTARGSNAVLKLDAATLLSTTVNPLLATVVVGPAPVGLTFVDGARALAVTNSNRFAGPHANQTIMFLDAAQATVLGQVAVGAFPRELGADAQTLFVGNFNSSTINAMSLTGLPLP